MTNEQKTLVILTPGFPENESDTVCLPMQQSLVRNLKKLHPELQIVVLSFQYPYQKKTYNWYGIKVVSFDGRNRGGIAKLMLRRKIKAALKTLNDNTQICGLLSFWYGECALVAERFASAHNLKHFCWILGQDAKKENSYPNKAPLKAQQLLALSDFLQTEFEKNHAVRPKHVLPAGIDEKLFDNRPARDIDLIAVGSLIPLKQFELFVQIVSNIKNKLTGIKAILIGNGPELVNLKQQIMNLKLEQNIILAGELPYEETLKTMQRSRVLLHPSLYEGFSGVCLEAIAAGAHVISFCQPMKEQIHHWHIVATASEMEKKSFDLLSDSKTKYEPVVYNSIDHTASRINELFMGSLQQRDA